MGKGKKVALAALVGLVVVAGAAAPFAYRPLLLVWAKHKAHQALAKFKPDYMKNLEVVPARITLPARRTDLLPLDTMQVPGSYTVCYPHPDSAESKEGSWLKLTYPDFAVHMLPAYSTQMADALGTKLGFPSYFDYELASEDTTPSDIDAAGDLASLKLKTLLLAEKSGGLSLSTYSAVFIEGDRRGLIRAVDPKKTSIHAVVFFPAIRTSDGMYFENKKGVDLNAVKQFLSVLRIEPAPAASLPVAGTER